MCTHTYTHTRARARARGARGTFGPPPATTAPVDKVDFAL